MSERPVQVSRAILFLWISIAIDVVELVLLGIEPDPNVSPEILWTTAIATLGLVALLIYLTSRAHNWARITLLVFAAILVVSSLFQIPAIVQGSSLKGLPELVGTVFVVFAMYWLFTGAGAAYFRHLREKPEA